MNPFEGSVVNSTLVIEAISNCRQVPFSYINYKLNEHRQLPSPENKINDINYNSCSSKKTRVGKKPKYFFPKIGFNLNTTPIRKYKSNFITLSTLITMKSLVTLLGFLVTSRPNHVQNSNELFHRTAVLYHFPLTPLFDYTTKIEPTHCVSFLSCILFLSNGKTLLKIYTQITFLKVKKYHPV